ncbi:hypothetical protein D9M69_607210 [compost metagenome]
MELQDKLEDRWIYQIARIEDGEPTHFNHLCPDCGSRYLVPIAQDAEHPRCCGRRTLFKGSRHLPQEVAHV